MCVCVIMLKFPITLVEIILLICAKLSLCNSAIDLRIKNNIHSFLLPLFNLQCQ